MRKAFLLLGITAAGAMALHGPPAAAQAKADSQEISIYVGEMFGEDLTDGRVSGSTPRMDNNVTYGARYDYYFTPQWGVDLSAGYTPTRITHAASGDSNFGLTTIDADAIWAFTPQSRLVGYTLAGVGWADSKLDHTLQGTVNGVSTTITDNHSFTANVGVGARYYATDYLVLRLEGRYRYLNKIIDTDYHSMNTFETTFGVGWRF